MIEDESSKKAARLLNHSELQDLWTRILDGQPLSGEETDAIKTFLETEDTQESEWLSHDHFTDHLLHEVYLTAQTDALDESDTSKFVEKVTRRIKDPAFSRPPIVPPPVVESVERMNPDSFFITPTNVQRLDQSQDSQSDKEASRSFSVWVFAATAASILIMLAASIVLLSRSSEVNGQASRNPGPLPVLRPRQGEQNEPPHTQQIADSILPKIPPTVEHAEPLVSDVVVLPTSDSSVTEQTNQESESIAADRDSSEMAPDLLSTEPVDSRLADSQSNRSQSSRSQLVARLVGAEDANWRNGQSPDTDLLAGPLALLSGQVRLRLAKGAELTLSGPVELELIDANRVALQSGFLEAIVPERAIGFEVQTPAVRIIDLGTRFTVNRLPDQSMTRVKVIEGTVQTIQPGRVRNGRERKTLLTEGRAKWFSHEGRQALDWRMDVLFGDRANDPNQLSIDGQSFDVSQPDQWVVGMRRMASKFQEAHDQIALVPRGERFYGMLVIDDKPQKLSSSRQVDAARTELMARIQHRWTETLLNEVFPQGMPDEMESFFRGKGIPFSRGSE